jgi:hypothetical protein
MAAERRRISERRDRAPQRPVPLNREAPQLRVALDHDRAVRGRREQTSSPEDDEGVRECSYLAQPAEKVSAVPDRNNGFVPDVYELIRRATLAKQQILATYNGHRRELCPHVIGTKDGRRQALFFQFGGGSSSGLPAGGEWRCLAVDELEDVVVRDGPWHTGTDHGYPETCVDAIDVEVPTE